MKVKKRKGKMILRKWWKRGVSSSMVKRGRIGGEKRKDAGEERKEVIVVEKEDEGLLV